MEPWYTNPIVIFGGVALLVSLGTAILKFGEWKGKVDSDRNTFSGFMDEIRADIRKIHDRIDAILGTLSNPVVSGTSPLSLTELGRSIAQSLEADQVVATMVPVVRTRVAGMSPYDVQELCGTYVKHEFEPSPELEAKIKDHAFENGIARFQVLDVLAIVLRDEILRQPYRQSN